MAKNQDEEQPHTTQPDKQEIDLIYTRLMTQIKEPDIKFSKYIGLRPLETFSENFDHFNYARGYHYFFNLKTFPRLYNSPSYAIDANNRFNYTYKYDNETVNGTKLSKIFNRKYIAIPSIQTTFDDRESKDKNVCHYHLFNVEDKKYHNNRLISKYKYVLKNLQKLEKKDKLKCFTQLKKDVVTHQVCDKNVSLQKKRQILKSRISVLEHRVKCMTGYWDWEDNTYYYFSLDQMFHNDAMSKGHKLTEQYLKDYIHSRIAYRKKYIEQTQLGQFPQNHQKMRYAIQTWMVFQEEQNNSLTTLMQNRLMAMPKVIQMFRTNQELVIFPLFTFNFGSKQIQKFIDPLIKAKMQKQHKQSFYFYEAFIKRVLKRKLACQQEQVVEPMNIQQYTYEMKLKILAIAQFYEKEIVSHKKVLFADKIIQLKKLQDSRITQKMRLLEVGHKIQISLKELMLLFFYRNISIALQQFIEYLKHDPEILKFMADQNYNQFHYGIAKILHQAEFCILINDVQRFSDMLSSRKTCPDLDKKLCFTFCEKLRIAYAWHEPISQEWQINQIQEIAQYSKPAKKIKI